MAPKGAKAKAKGSPKAKAKGKAKGKAKATAKKAPGIWAPPARSGARPTSFWGLDHVEQHVVKHVLQHVLRLCRQVVAVVEEADDFEEPSLGLCLACGLGPATSISRVGCAVCRSKAVRLDPRMGVFGSCVTLAESEFGSRLRSEDSLELEDVYLEEGNDEVGFPAPFGAVRW